MKSMTSIDQEAQDVSLEEISIKIKNLIVKLIDLPECTLGKSLAAIIFQLMSEGLQKSNMNSILALTYIKNNFTSWATERSTKLQLGVFFHSFNIQLASVDLKVDIITQNALRFLGSQEFLKLPYETVNDLLKIVPCAEIIAGYADNTVVIGDLQALWVQAKIYDAYRDHYATLIKNALDNDMAAKMRLFDIQHLFERALPPKFDLGEFIIGLSKSWVSHIIQLQMWINTFTEVTDDPDNAWKLAVYRRKEAFKEHKSFRDVITAYRKQPLENDELQPITPQKNNE